MIAAPSYPNRAACLSRYSRISAIMGSSSGGVISFLHELFGRADDCRPIARISAYLINLRCVCRVSDMPKIPCYQLLDAKCALRRNVTQGAQTLDSTWAQPGSAPHNGALGVDALASHRAMALALGSTSISP